MSEEIEHIIEFKNLVYGSLEMKCSCGRKEFCHRWMTADMWNETKEKFEKHGAIK